MKITLATNVGLPVVTREVVLTGRMPELIRWEERIFAHHFTRWPQQTSEYRETPVLDMPPPLPPNLFVTPNE